MLCCWLFDKLCLGVLEVPYLEEGVEDQEEQDDVQKNGNVLDRELHL